VLRKREEERNSNEAAIGRSVATSILIVMVMVMMVMVMVVMVVTASVMMVMMTDLYRHLGEPCFLVRLAICEPSIISLL
jgi:hypothetical protein